MKPKDKPFVLNSTIETTIVNSKGDIVALSSSWDMCDKLQQPMTHQNLIADLEDVALDGNLYAMTAIRELTKLLTDEVEYFRIMQPKKMVDDTKWEIVEGHTLKEWDNHYIIFHVEIQENTNQSTDYDKQRNWVH
ncbi:hypothetical protein [Vibrio barjaei]|uniref:hypothetical protein n=1 Tax=Vibrio barjaei TaxID=1676683 RepID=UPI002284C9F7|nr:hypothetical protein [Vibrio barjaei]MCY9870397.1 hypothetical protein [Vibrio barjaei]